MLLKSKKNLIVDRDQRNVMFNVETMVIDTIMTIMTSVARRAIIAG